MLQDIIHIIAIALIITVLILAFIWTIYAICTETKIVTVYEVSDRVITIEDEDGNLFDFFKGNREYKVGDKLKVNFDKKTTKAVEDDEIRWIEEIND